MPCFRLSEKIADYLMDTLLFRMHGYTIAFDVQIRDVSKNGKALAGEKRVPLLICAADRVLCGIALDYDASHCFYQDMERLPYVQLPSIHHALPMGLEDESWLDHIPAETLETLLSRLKQTLIPLSLRSSAQEGYRLHGLPADEALPSAGADLYPRLQKKFLLAEDGSPTAYGSAHGLFMCWSTDADGKCSSRLWVSQSAATQLQKAMAPYSRKAAIRPLAERMQQLTQQPDSSDYDLSGALNRLLKIPVSALLCGKPDALKTLSAVLSICRHILNSVPDTNADLTYGQLLQLLQQLRCGFGEDPELDNWQSHQKRRVSESLLILLADIFMPHQTQATATASARRQSLQQRLAGVRDDPQEQLANTPLSAYCQTVSILADSNYPNWIYQTRIRPLFEDQDKPENRYTLRFLAAYCKLCFEDTAVKDWEETFPLLYCLALPECFS